MKIQISDNIIRHYLRNVYFINGHSYAGKSTMVKMLSERYNMIFCGENYHDTFPEYRGRRLMGTLISHAISEAKKQGAEKIYICTDHVGLYEKYGFTYMESRPDVWGEISRIYYQDI